MCATVSNTIDLRADVEDPLLQMQGDVLEFDCLPPNFPKHGLISSTRSRCCFRQLVSNLGLERFIAAAKFAPRGSTWASAYKGELISRADAAMKKSLWVFCSLMK
jgi:hypothetical protein